MVRRVDDTTILLECKSPEERKRLLAALFTRYRGRLRAVVELRLDRRLRARVDPSRVLQEALVEAFQELEDHCREATPLPLYVWLRKVTAQRLVEIHRSHLDSRSRRDSRRRAPAREASPDEVLGPPSCTGVLAPRLLGEELSLGRAAVRAEARPALKQALDRLRDSEREMVALRHFEGLTGNETAALLGVSLEAANKRYMRAMEKLRRFLVEAPGAKKRPRP